MLLRSNAAWSLALTSTSAEPLPSLTMLQAACSLFSIDARVSVAMRLLTMYTWSLPPLRVLHA